MIYTQTIGEKNSFKTFPTNNLYELSSIICFSKNSRRSILAVNINVQKGDKEHYNPKMQRRAVNGNSSCDVLNFFLGKLEWNL